MVCGTDDEGATHVGGAVVADGGVFDHVFAFGIERLAHGAADIAGRFSGEGGEFVEGGGGMIREGGMIVGDSVAIGGRGTAVAVSRGGGTVS